MTISVKSSIQSHVNNAFAAKPTLETLDFVKRLYLAEFDAIKETADLVMNRAFNKANHSDAYITLLNYTLEKHSLTETMSLFADARLDGDDDVVEHNLILLAKDIVSYDNTWQFFKKRDIVSEINDILSKPPVTSTVETLTNNG